MKTPREQIFDFIHRNFIGPGNLETDENGEEIIHEFPTKRYISGILFPHCAAASEAQDEDANGGDDIESGDSDTPEETNDEWLRYSNRVLPSAISLSVALRDDQIITFKANAGFYSKKDGTSDADFIFQRHDLSLPEANVSASELRKKKMADIPLSSGGDGLVLKVYYRGTTADPKLGLYTFALINEKEISEEESKKRLIDYSKCFFQCSFSLFDSNGFSAIPSKNYNGADEDQENNKLLYRDIHIFAYGHGCSPIWDDGNARVVQVSTSFMPSYIVSSTTHTESKDIDCDLSMLSMSKEENDNHSFADLGHLCDQYSAWIEDIKVKASTLGQDFQKTAWNNIESCEQCVERIKNGLLLLKENPTVLRAFHLMNESMVLQQLHYNLPKRFFDEEGRISKYIDPIVSDPNTWPNKKRYGFWRPFQIAFILMNLESISKPESSERKLVDLIWFPTGGGKTEAYLGLSSFAIFYERLSKTKSSQHSISVLMRYTLRLLTSQQYQRATSLICACEYIRQTDKTNDLGDLPITIGLFVGKDTSPNTMSDAVSVLKELRTGSSGTTADPFVVRKCPWCGAQIGYDKGHQDAGHCHGYCIRHVAKSKEQFYYRCDDPDCFFHNQDLPLSVIDQALFENPPTLLIGTVDKFATIVFNHDAQHLFGIYDGVKKDSPSLVIQDELHLISGPLGSMVAIYETLLDELLKDGRGIMPKIIASTATISRAKEQCHDLFNVPRDAVKAFPPSGIDFSDSFFAHQGEKGSGRQYVGIFAPGSPSTSTTSIWLYSALFEMPLHVTFPSEEIKDSYWTNVGYYNSLRELGKATTWIHSDIVERCEVLGERYKTSGQRDPKKLNYCELTSRHSGEEIPDSLHALEINKGSSDGAVDICLATNMISVGLDVQRLGLMTVIGQPKTSSEYIQATSRVGRDYSRPGIIFTLLSPLKPRDKSVFESFEAYHSKYYAYVEPTSVSVFSPQIRRQALPAILFGTMFLLSSDGQAKNVVNMLSSQEYQKSKRALMDRVHDLDPEEEADTQKQIQDLEAVVDKHRFDRYCFPLGSWKFYSKQTERPLIYPKGTGIPVDWIENSNAAAMSMRDVDATCNFAIWKI